MFKLLVLASLVTLSVAAPAEVVSKSAHSETVENKNDPYNPYDDTVVKKSSVHETVKTDNGVVAVDKTTAAVGVPVPFTPAVAALYNPYSLTFNPFSPFYNPENLYNPYSYYNVFNPSSPFYYNSVKLLSPPTPTLGYAPFNPYAHVSHKSYQVKGYYAY